MARTGNSVVADLLEKKRRWTLLVYMVSDAPITDTVADVDLDEVLKQERRAIRAAVTDDVYIAIQVDYLREPGTFRSIDGEEANRHAEGSAVDREVLNSFFTWGVTECPADRYAVMFWGHSSGPSGLFADSTPTFGFARPSHPSSVGSHARSLNLAVLGETFDHANEQIARQAALMRGSSTTLEIVLFKDCFQSILETAFELGQPKDGGIPRVRYMIGSQALIPIATETAKVQRSTFLPKQPRFIEPWPYRQLFQFLTGAETANIATKIGKSLGNFYTKPENRADHIEVPISVLDLSAMKELVKPLKDLTAAVAQTLDEPSTSDLVRFAIERAFRGVVDGDPMLVDVSSLCDRLSELNRKEFEAPVGAVRSVLPRVVRHCEPPKGQFKGVSVYHYQERPAARAGTAIGHVSVPDYERLKISELTDWNRVALADTPLRRSRQIL